MNANDSFERSVRGWLQADAEHQMPDHLEAVLERTRRERQRPAWSSLERWLPVDLTTRANQFAPPRLGWALLIAALLLALAGIVLVVGSQQRRLPAPFGPAMAGLTAYEEAGDIYTLDLETGGRTLVAAGPERDEIPVFSLDGTKLAFFRFLSDAEQYVLVATPDGDDVRRVSASLDRWSTEVWSPDLAWSGDGSRIAVAEERVTPRPGELRNVISIIDVPSGTSHALDVGMAARDVSWLPPRGEELVFIGTPTDGPEAIWAVRPDGTGLRQLIAQEGMGDDYYVSPIVSPDGHLLAFSQWDGKVTRLRMVDLVDGSTWALPSAPLGDRYAIEFSPDSRSVLVMEQRRDGAPPTERQLAVAPVDGSTSGVALGPVITFTSDAVDGESFKATFSPDGRSVLALPTTDDPADGILWTLPIDGSQGTSEPWSNIHLPNIQRVAP